MKRLPAVLLLCLLLPACLPFATRGPAAEIYTPDIAITLDPELPRVTWQLVVARPVAGQLMDSNRILVRPRPGQLQVYSGAVWAESAPNLVQTAVVQAFEDSSRILAVGRPGGGLRADYTLSLELRRFESVYVGAEGLPEVRVEVHAKLLHSGSNQVLGARTFRATSIPADTSVPRVAEAFSAPLSEVVEGLVSWTLTVGEANARNVRVR